MTKEEHAKHLERHPDSAPEYVDMDEEVEQLMRIVRGSEVDLCKAWWKKNWGDGSDWSKALEGVSGAKEVRAAVFRGITCQRALNLLELYAKVPVSPTQWPSRRSLTFIFQLHVQKYIPAGELIRLTYISQEPWMHTLYMHTIVLTLE